MVGPDRGRGGGATRELVPERLGEPLAQGSRGLRAAAPALREDARDGGVLRVGVGQEHGIPLVRAAIDPRGVGEKGAVERAGTPLAEPRRQPRLDAPGNRHPGEQHQGRSHRDIIRRGSGAAAHGRPAILPGRPASTCLRRFRLSASGLGLRRLVRREHRDEHALLQVGRQVGDRIPHSHGQLLPARDHDEGDVVVVVLAPARWRSPSEGSGAAASGPGGRTGSRPRPCTTK